MSNNNYFEAYALRVEQPLGAFYVVSIPASKLIDVCYSDPAEKKSNGLGLTGTQRIEDEKRQIEISEYINTKEAAFPNSIIIGANYSSDGELIESEDSWRVEEFSEVDGGVYKLVIPSSKKIASIIDGQHRLNSFDRVGHSVRDSFDLVCSVYMDLPVPYHAYLFSTINFNQKKVDRSLAYNLFGFDIEASDPKSWVPETLAVSVARKLNSGNTPFKDGISLGVVGGKASSSKVRVSMATVVDGLLKLFSKRPKKDRSILMTYDRKERSRSLLEEDGSPLRFLYLKSYDDVIFEVVVNYFTVVDEFFWSIAPSDSYINKTVGIQALFDILYDLLRDFSENLEGSIEDFQVKLERARDANLDFTQAEASGKGKSMIRQMLADHL